MKFLINALAALTALIMALGAAVGLMPLALVSPEHEVQLVQIQVCGACVFVVAFVALNILGVIAAWLDRRVEPSGVNQFFSTFRW